MRVIAGSAGGVRLAVPKRGVRPTMDQVKAAIFSSLGEAIIGARVLDLFAGSGALGIEALSRGAASAIFVEHDRESGETIEKNLAKTKLKGRVRRQNVFDFLRQTSDAEASSVILSEAQRSRRIPPNHTKRGNRVGERFDIVFADPPYEKDHRGKSDAETLLNNERLPQLLEPNGILVLEKRPSDTLTEMNIWRVIRQKTYGATQVLFLAAVY